MTTSESRLKLQEVILKYQNIAQFLNTTFSGELSEEDQVKYAALKGRAEYLAVLPRNSDIIEIVAKLRELIENAQKLSGMSDSERHERMAKKYGVK